MKNSIHRNLDRLLHDRVPGTKISVYIPIRGDLPAHLLFTSLRESGVKLIPELLFAKSFRKWLQGVYDTHRGGKSTRTLACFYSDGVREVIALDKEIPPRVVVAQSWHVKPLMYVADLKPWGHIIDFNESGVSILRTDGESVDDLGTIVPMVNSTLPSKFWHDELDRESLRKLACLVASRVSEGSVVQILGAPDGFMQSPKFWQAYWTNVSVDTKSTGSIDRQTCLRNFGLLLSNQMLLEEPLDMLKIFKDSTPISDPEKITRLILERKIFRIYISLEAIRWGVLNENSGDISMSKFQKNHHDEDILDDIAELALRYGLEVRVLRQSSFPENCEILAL